MNLAANPKGFKQVKHFTESQIRAGLELAQAWYEAFKIEDIEGDQLIEAIEKSEQNRGAAHAKGEDV